MEEGECFGVEGDFSGLGDIESCGDAFGLHACFVEDPKASLGEAVACCGGGDDAQTDSGQRHDGQETVELSEHGVDVSDTGVQGLLFEDEGEAAISGVEDVLTLHAGGHGLLNIIVGQIEETVPEFQDTGRIVGGVEQTGDDRVFIATE